MKSPDITWTGLWDIDVRSVDGDVIDKLYVELGIKKQRSSLYHPEGDCQAGRSVHFIKALINCHY